MSKNRLARMFEISESITPVSERTAPVEDAAAAADKSHRTGVGVATHASRLQSKVDSQQAVIDSLQSQLDSASADAHRAIPLELIGPNPWQPRIVVDEKGVDLLAESMSVNGLIQPIVVRKDPVDEKKYQLLAGQRRLLAATALGWQTIPAVLLDVSDDSMAVYSLTENLARADLSDYETGKALAVLTATWPSKRLFAKTFGMERAHMLRCLTFERLPQFIRDDLDKTPYLLGGSGAAEIVKRLDPLDEDFLLVLKEGWAALVAGEIDQSKLLKILGRRRGGASATAPVSTTLEFEGNVIGEFRSGDKRLDIRLKAGLLGEEDQDLLKEYIKKLISGSAV